MLQNIFDVEEALTKFLRCFSRDRGSLFFRCIPVLLFSLFTTAKHLPDPSFDQAG